MNSEYQRTYRLSSVSIKFLYLFCTYSYHKYTLNDNLEQYLVLFVHICYDFCVEIACMHGNIDICYHMVNQN